jgi:hypothetical protein
MKKLFLSIAIALLMTACAPSTKQDYMAEFGEFVETISEQSSEYDADDWVSADAEFDKYVGEWYNRYEPEMSLSDKMQVVAWTTAYNYHKGVSKAGSAIDELGNDFNEGLKELGKGIEEIGKSMQED